MLPKKRKVKNNKKEVGQQIKQRMGSVFEAYYAKHGRPEDKKH